MIAKANVIGMIINVLVNLTMIAYEVAAGENIEAAATTDDTSLTAVPAQRPNACGVMANKWPMVGKVRTAITLNVKIVAIA